MIFTRGRSTPCACRKSRKRSYMPEPAGCSSRVISVAVTIGSRPRSRSSRTASTAFAHAPAPRMRSFFSGSVSSRLTRSSSEYGARAASAASASAIAGPISVPLVSTVVGAAARASSRSGRISPCRNGSPPVK